MALAIGGDHLALAEVARSLLTDKKVAAAARAAVDGSVDAPDAFWADVAGLGWFGLHVEERFGGQGFGMAELAVVIEELGRVVAPGPVLPSITVAAAVQRAGTDDQKDRWLPGLAGGTTRIGLDVGDGVVAGAVGVDAVAIRLGEDLHLVASGSVTVGPVGSLDPGLGVARVTGAPPAGDVIVGGGPIATRVLNHLSAASATGGLYALLEQAVGYAAVREQFGRPIGSFQAIKHHCANMLLDAELTAAVTWDAGRDASSDGEGELVAAVAGGWALSAYLRVAELAIQVHGGIAYTWEHDAHLHLRRALALAMLLDAPRRQRAAVVAAHRFGMRRRATIAVPAEAEAEARRQAARAFADSVATVDEPDRPAHFARSGYLVPHWPVPYGLGATPAEQLVIDEELSGIERPSLGLGEWVVPTILQHGTAEQKERLLWPSLEGELRWCQLFSEPNAGSDAAAVRTKAVRVEGGWRVNGQKVWTSDARSCQRGLATVRTNSEVPKHKGITAMVIDMAAPGVEIRPIREITGEAFFNEVFFDDVFVPDEDVLGDVDDGWRVARSTLGNERISIGGGSVTMEADALVPLLDRYRPGEADLAAEVGALLIEAQALRVLNLRHAERAVITAEPGVEGSLSKLFGAEHAQRIATLAARLAGAAAATGNEPAVVHDWLFTKCLTIAGGTSEVLRNQIAERILGLPKEPT